MTTTLDVQRRLMQAVLSGDATTVTPLLRVGLSAPSERVAIYRRHYLASLTESLASVYPVTNSLVGESFFSVLAERYIELHPPQDPRLSRYGALLADVVEASHDCVSLAYLPDVARLEWALSKASRAVLPAPLSATEIREKFEAASVRPRLQLLPSLSLLRSAWPVAEVWRAHQGGAVQGTVHLEARETLLQIAADHGGPYFRAVTTGEYTLKRELLAGSSLEEALGHVMREESSLDPVSLLTRLFEEGCIVGVASEDEDDGAPVRSFNSELPPINTVR